MAEDRRRVLLGLLGVGLMSTMNGCAAAGPDVKVRHGLQIEVDKSVGRAVDIRYTYGDELIDQVKPSANSVGPFMTYMAPMHVPEEFAIRWQTENGAKHDAKVPVRSRLPGSVEGKTIVFVIKQDHVEGYVSVSGPFGPKRERFY